jgi:hypothetical protein
MAVHEFTCAKCGETYDSEWTDDERWAECVENFGPIEPGTPHDVICDDCYEKFMRWWKERARN